ncbi:MAG TPA: hypothetical protein VEH84_15960 [Alphaproteobacteria bacterium]|nr:hypothetical protein [Alphaproteobacteria bacterium]
MARIGPFALAAALLGAAAATAQTGGTAGTQAGPSMGGGAARPCFDFESLQLQTGRPLGRAELADLGRRVFRAWDVDGDGRIARAEFLACRSASAQAVDPQDDGAVFAEWDENGDGFLAEGEALSQRRIATIDRDGDGQIALEELRRVF